MNFFSDYSAPLWELFIGNLLLLVTGGFYIAWWTVSFKPNWVGNTAVAGPLLLLAFLAGLAALVFISLGIYSLSQFDKGLPVGYILIGAVITFIVLLAVTVLVFHRPLTSELFLMVAWATLELSVIAVLQGSGRFGKGQTITLAVLVTLATIAGIVCYVLYYRLDDNLRYWLGLAPLVADGVVVLVFTAILVIS